MNRKGSLLFDSVHTRLKIYPSRQCIAFLNSLPDEEEIPDNILKAIDRRRRGKINKFTAKPNINLNDDDVKNMKKINDIMKDKGKPLRDINKDYNVNNSKNKEALKKKTCTDSVIKGAGKVSIDKIANSEGAETQVHSKHFLTIMDIDWIYNYLQEKRDIGVDVPYLHVLLEGAKLVTPKNKIIERNPELEARCLLLKAHEAGEGCSKMSLKVTVEDLSAKIKHLEGFSSQRLKQHRIPLMFGNWNKYVHNKRINMDKKEKEHQD